MSSPYRKRPVRKRWSWTRRTGPPMPNLLMDGKYQGRWILVAVPDRVLADLVGRVIVGPEHVGKRRVAVGDVQADAIALLELEGIRLDADLELIDLAGLDRLRVFVQKVGLHLGAVLLVDGAVGCAQPALGHDLESRVEALRPVFRRLRKLLGELDDKIGVFARRGRVQHELDRTGDLEVLLQRRAGEGQHAARRIEARCRPRRAKAHDAGDPSGIGVTVSRIFITLW